ncbi:MAG: hypothetical protein AAF228_09325 [Pseudomonadota bacterium]
MAIQSEPNAGNTPKKTQFDQKVISGKQVLHYTEKYGPYEFIRF